MSSEPNLPQRLVDKQISLQQIDEGCSPTPQKTLLTIVEHLYFLSTEDPTIEIVSRFSRDIQEEDEQPYTRKMTAKETWQALDIGWVESPSMVIIENQEGRNLQKVQSQEETDQLKQDKTLRLTYISPSEKPVGYLLIPPGESLRFQPHNIKHLCIRCGLGTAKYKIHAFPK